MKKFLLFFCLFNWSAVLVFAQTHPCTFTTVKEIEVLKKSINTYSLYKQSFEKIKKEVDPFLQKEVDVPFPKDAAGGYTHDKHKANYTLMFNSGMLYQLTGKKEYAELVKKMLLKYALLNPTLNKHPQATSSSPGRIFWQALNDANWMVYTGMAYDLVYNHLTLAERKTIEEGAFKPEVDYFTKDLKNWFNLIHNHAVWACAGVGIIGLATNNEEYVQMALKSTEKNGKAGFIAHLDNLFSPDGYYTEGPYYVRYAILPYILFANAINNAKANLKIFQHRDNILQKALMTCLQQTNLNGSFYPLNDAIKEKDFTSNELITAVDIASDVYGINESFLFVAQKHNRVILNKSGFNIAKSLQEKKVPTFFPYTTLESTDGTNGTEGGVSILRNGKEEDLTTLIFKYASQGLSHGHYDRLGINIFDKGNEILQDYGSVRFIGIEQKYGGRYLPENTTYAAQTIAHNTVVIDETSHFNGDGDEGQKYPSQKLFSNIKNAKEQVVMAKEENAYKGTILQRSVYLLQNEADNKLLFDVFTINTEGTHQYDLPFQYNGSLISTSFKVKAHKNSQTTLGAKNGYQFLWKVAEASLKDTIAQVTYLNKNSFYTISSLIEDSAKIFFTRAGANDPNFNLRPEPSYIIRKKGADKTFVNVIEIHGKYDSVNEFSTNSYSNVKSIKVESEDENNIVVAIQTNAKRYLLVQCKKDFNASAKHSITVNNRTINWVGPYIITETKL